MFRSTFGILVAVACCGFGKGFAIAQSEIGANERLPAIRISEDQRYLITEAGAPFFGLGDASRDNGSDWVLVLDDADQHYPPPGKKPQP